MKFLIINPFGIGDVLFTTPLLRTIKQECPESSISYWCNQRIEPILANNPYLEKIFPLSRGDLKKVMNKSWISGVKMLWNLFSALRKERFDICFDFSLDYRYGLIAKLCGIKKRIGYNFKNRARFLNYKKDIDGYKSGHIVEYYLKLLDFINLIPETKNIDLFVSKNGTEKASVFLESCGVKESDLLIAIAPGAGLSWGKDASYKHWPPEKFAQVADRLIENHKTKILLFGDGLERDITDTLVHHMRYKPIDLVGRLTLCEYIDYLSKADILIANDGGPLHMAVALGLKTVSIFGPVDDLVYGPYSNNSGHKVLKRNLSCRPCYKNFRFAGCINDRKCLEDISVDEVYAAVEESLCVKK